VALSIAVFCLLYVTGFLINAITDREADLKYSTFKRRIGEAAARLGNRRIYGLIAFHLAAGLAITVELSRRLGNPWLVALVCAGVFLGLAYSAPPFSLKTRGVVAHALSLSLSAFTVPFLFLYVAARGTVDLAGVLVVGTFTVVGYALEYTNQAYDFTEDLEAGMATPAVRLGLIQSLKLSVVAFVVALPLLAFSLAYLALSRPALSYGLGEAWRPLVVAGAVVAVLAGYAVALRGLARILRAAREEGADSQVLVERVRKECNYSLWQSAGVTGLFAFALAVFLLSASAASDLRTTSLAAYDLEGTAQSSPGPLGSFSVQGTVQADAQSPLPEGGTVVVEWDGPSGTRRLAEAPIGLPQSGDTTQFHLSGLLPAPGAGDLRVALLVDSDFDGSDDLEVASAPVAWGPLP
jgi:4-hydroxybenzoate polyprenyltransferase